MACWGMHACCACLASHCRHWMLPLFSCLLPNNPAKQPVHASVSTSRRTVAWNISLETTLSSAAVARGFASYLATLIGLPASALRINAGPIQLDPAAALLVLFLTALLIKGTKESSRFNMVSAARTGHGRGMWASCGVVR